MGVSDVRGHETFAAKPCSVNSLVDGPALLIAKFNGSVFLGEKVPVRVIDAIGKAHTLYAQSPRLGACNSGVWIVAVCLQTRVERVLRVFLSRWYFVRVL